MMAQATLDNRIRHDFSKHYTRYWLMPPDLYNELNKEFQFDHDPCPFPKPKGFNGLVGEWGQMNFVNPPFRTVRGIGPTAFVKKAIEQAEQGRSSVLVLPTAHYTNLLLEAGALLRSMGRIRWLEVDTKKPMPNPSPITAFILRGKTSDCRR